MYRVYEIKGGELEATEHSFSFEEDALVRAVNLIGEELAKQKGIHMSLDVVRYDDMYVVRLTNAHQKFIIRYAVKKI